METIVMIHGMWGNGAYWKNYKTYFEAKGYNCIVPILRYHDGDPKGRPHPALGTTSLLDYAKDLEEIIKGLDQTPILMGHSMGGLLAQILGSRNAAKALVLLTPAPPRWIFALKLSVLRCFSEALLTWGFWRKPNRPSLKKMAYAVWHLFPAEQRKTEYENVVWESGRAATEIGFWLKESTVDASKIDCPVLVVSGSEDRITPESVVRKVAEKYGATYKTFENHAHWVVGEPGWENIAAYIDDWIKGLRK